MRGPRQLTAMVGALLTAFALLLLGAPPSAAGGPTSVLLVSPTDRRTASLYGAEKAYDFLTRLLATPTGSESDGSREEAPEWGREDIWGEQIGDMVTVTWMIHDVTPWRVDRVFTSAPDTKDVWIHTTLDIAQDADAPGEGVWHKAKQSGQLRDLLTGLGVLGKASGSPAQGAPPSADALAEAGADTAGTTTGTRAAANTPDLTDRARWAIPALALGLLLGSGGATLLLRRAAARHESGPPRETRQELLDA